MLRETVGALRDLSRLHEIAAVLVRHGLGDLVFRLGIIGMLERAGRALHLGQVDNEREYVEPPVRVRRALEELGPTFVKLGQVLATRVDVFSSAWIAEFERLQSAVAPLPMDAFRDELTRALGAPVDEVFQEVGTEPIGSASIAQVHRARLQDGTAVVLKMRRPGIEAKIDADLRILAHIAALFESEFPETRRYQPSEIVGQFARSIQRELDFSLEGRNMDRFRGNFEDDPNIIIPKVYWEWTSPGLIVQDYIDGIPGNQLEDLEAAGLDRKLLASRGSDAVLKMILIDGFFHADPHPGNMFYLPGNRLALLDFGMVGRLTPVRRDQMVDLLVALAARDPYGMQEVLTDWTGDEPVDEEKLTDDLAEMMFRYEHAPLKDIRFGQLLSEITAIMREHGVVLPSDLTLLFKALITLEGLGRQLDPEFRMVEHMTPFVRQVVIERYHPRSLWKKGSHGVREGFSLLSGLPRDVVRLVKEVRRGRMKIDLDLKRLDHFGHQLERATNRLTLGIVTGALIIGSSIVMTVPSGTWLGLFGFSVAFLNGLWIIFSIWRARHD